MVLSALEPEIDAFLIGIGFAGADDPFGVAAGFLTLDQVPAKFAAENIGDKQGRRHL